MNENLTLHFEDGTLAVDIAGKKTPVWHGTLSEVVNYHLNRFEIYLDMLADSGCDDKAEVGRSVLTCARTRIAKEVLTYQQLCGEMFILKPFGRDEDPVGAVFVPRADDHFNELIAGNNSIAVVQDDF